MAEGAGERVTEEQQPGADGKITRFDDALLRVSNCLAEAEDCAARDLTLRAEHLFRVAEVFALRSGYLELVRLVWAYDGLGVAAGRGGSA